jgi:F420-dependent oxidoreductase-like protein
MPVRLGLTLSYFTSAGDVANLALAREADALGYSVVWIAEAYGSDAPTVLSWIAAQTDHIALGSGAMQIPARSPAMTAMTAATLDVLTGGRFRLGLGVSGPQVAEGWHGMRFAKPLARTREYVDIVRMALSGQRVRYEGETYTLPLPDGPGKPLALTIRPVSEHIPIYLAAVGPKNLELAGEIADGWLAIFYAPRFAAEQLAHIVAGRARVGKTLTGFDIVPTVPVVVGTDVAACADRLRPYAALYLGGMGSRKQNFYNALAVRMGYADAAAEVQQRYLSRDYEGAAAAVPMEFIDDTALLGPPDRIAQRMARFAESGVTTLTVQPVGGDLDERMRVLTVAADALRQLPAGGAS